VLKTEFAAGVDVAAEFKKCGGSDANLRWLKRELERRDPVEVKKLFKEVRLGPPGRRLELPPCVVYGQIEIPDEGHWLEGLVEGKLTIEAVVHSDFEPAYFQRRAGLIKPRDQEEDPAPEDDG